MFPASGVDAAKIQGDAVSVKDPSSGQVLVWNDYTKQWIPSPVSGPPLPHKASHATGGSDALSPSDIGAAPTIHTHTSAQILDATETGRSVLTAAAEFPVSENIIVTGAGTPAANGIYYPAGTLNGRVLYNQDGPDPSYIWWNLSTWALNSGFSSPAYYSNEDVATPDLCSTWTAVFGAAPVPTVTAARKPPTDAGLAVLSAVNAAAQLALIGAAPTSHTHAQADVTELTTSSAPTFAGLTLSSGSLTASAPIALSQTWNSSGVTFTGLKFNATATASAAASLLVDFQAGGSSKFKIRKDGVTTTSALVITSHADVGNSIGGVGLALAGLLAWSGTSGNPSASTTLALLQDASGTLAQRNGTNAQTSRLYGTYTDASNYRRLAIGSTTAGVFSIAPEGAGTGATGNVLHISGLPTSNPGAGILWNNGGNVAIGT